MAAEQISRRPLKLYVHGHSLGNYDEMWYCIDLESLPEADEQFSPVAVFGVDTLGGGWTLIGDHIYWAAKMNDAERFYPMLLRRHNIKTSPNPYSLDPVSGCERRLLQSPHLITLDGNGNGNRILVLGVKEVIFHEEDEDYDHDFLGEVYDLDTGIWHNWAFNLRSFTAEFPSFHTTLLRDEEGKAKQVLFYSFNMGNLLFYNVLEDTFSIQHHPQFVLIGGLYPIICDIPSVHILRRVVANVSAALMDSTLYWFTYELRLYGYDFIRERWFHSPPLRKEQLWDLHNESHAPFLVDMYNGKELVLLVQTPCSKLGIAFLVVSKQGKSLDVIVKSRHTFSVNPTFLPYDGIAIAYELVERTKSESTPREAEFEANLNEAKSEVEEFKEKLMNREVQFVDISDENKGLSLHVEQMQSADREFELATQLKKSESILGDLIANLIDKETELQILMEEYELLKSEMKNRESESTKIIDKALALVEAAKTAEREALIKLGDLTEEADKSSRKIAHITEELNAAQAANSEIETELRRLKVQCDQWRKAAEAAASMLSTGNNGKYVERTASLDQDSQS